MGHCHLPPPIRRSKLEKERFVFNQFNSRLTQLASSLVVNGLVGH